ncbi:MAG: NAD-dependent epimerase/dehydratase family protein [Candidatus Lokiarchaeota archaeon]|nr:NAD-dependent epimerase/dehydratase family protein [Candidatus Lokiarchaeota archaeon]
MTNILVTGGTGFIGIPLVKKLHELGHKLKLLVRESSNTAPFKELKDIEYIFGDIQDINSLEKAVNNVDAIYHLAAYTAIWAKDKSIYYDVNVKGTENVANIALQNNLNLFYVSSFTALGPTPSEPVDEPHEDENFFMEYEKSKFQAKKLVRSYIPKGLKVMIFYPGIVYGPGDFNIFGRMLFDVMRGKILPLGICPGKGESMTCLSYVKDTSNALADVIDREDLFGEDFILGGENVTFKDYLDLIAEIGRNKKARKLPFTIAMVYAWLLEVRAKFNKNVPFLTRPTLRAIKYHRSYSSKKAIDKFGYKITPLREGLEETIKWYKEYDKESKKKK